MKRMTDLIIKPTKLKGTVNVPPSKSMAHRAIISACLAGGKSVIRNIDLSDDIIATIEGMKAFGSNIEILDDAKRKRLEIEGVPFKQATENRLIDANESGSTLRFLIPIATLFEGKNRFIGRGQLGARPLDTFEKIFNAQGLLYKPSGTSKLDLTVEGPLKAGTYEMAGNISSQFITGLLFTLPLLEGDSEIVITTELESVGYLELTLEVLKDFGVQVDYDKKKQVFSIPGNQSYQPQDYTVEGDYSQAAFFLSAGALGNDVVVTGLKQDSNQGDKSILNILEQLNAMLKVKEDTVAVTAPDGLEGDVIIDGAQVPDIIPISALVASLSPGKTKIINLKRLRIKESDRLEATKAELEKIGANIQVVGDELHIQGVSQLQGDNIGWSHKDHRMAMMLAIASTVCKEEIVIRDADYVSKSYPTFWREFEALGGQINEWNMGK